MMAASSPIPATSLLSIHHQQQQEQQHTQRSFQYPSSTSSPHYPPHPSMYYPAGLVPATAPSPHYYPSAVGISSSASPSQQQSSMDFAVASSSSAKGSNAALSAAKAKSSAAKRASAKAAAANKKAQAAASAQAAAASNSSGDDDDDDGDDRASAVTKGKGKSRAGSTSSPTPDGKSGDWVVPQRAKPGRKPSQEEPLTKRQAQNRASQRAFRERKQSHVATLEAKVAAYEAEKLTRDAREKENHKKLIQENESLQRDNAALKSKVQELETALEQLRTSGNAQVHRSSGTSAARAAGYDAGCRAPTHEQDSSPLPTTQRRKRPLPSRAYDEADCRNVAGPSTTPSKSLGSAAGPSFASAMELDSYNESSQAVVAPLSDHDDDGDASFPYLSSNQRLASGSSTSPDFLPVNDDIDMLDPDCGFCTDATPCLCRGDAILDLTGMDDGGGAPTTASGVDRMIKIEEDVEGEEKQQQDGNNIPHAAIAISSLLSSRPRSATQPKLWSLVSDTKTPSSAATTSKKSKLWWTRPASAQSYWTPSVMSFVHPGEKRLNEQVYGNAMQRRNSLVAAGATQEEIEAALCSGDPSNCAACATDPALAAFCEAIGEDDEGGSVASAAAVSDAMGPSVSLPSRKKREGETTTGISSATGNASRPSPYSSSSATGHPIPLSTSYRPRSTSINTIPTLRSLDLDLGSRSAPRGSGSSIPDAFRQLRSHPGFPRWQGGLNLLADVVSGRGPPGMGSRISESTDREVMMDEEPDDAATSHSATLRTAGSSHLKRRRLYVENDRVREALRMLDGGSGAAVTSSSSSLGLRRLPALVSTQGSGSVNGSGGAPCMECPCPCPWAQQGREGSEEE